jgi:hypothetical protein
MRGRLLTLITLAACSIAWGQSQTPTQGAPAGNSSSAESGSSQSTSGTDMSGMSHQDTSNMKDMPMDSDKDTGGEAATHAMHAMEGRMDMGPHMKMTALRHPKPGDVERAQRVVEAARQVSEKYADYRTALADGFKIFHPELPQKIYHFTSSAYAIEAQFRFNPEHPTSLLYEKHGDDYKLVGVMYTAPKRFTEDQLDERIPLSIAQWHEHVNFCMAPLSKMGEGFQPHPQFGMRGSIATREACDAAGGRFIPVVFNWMVHVYPFARDQAAIWSVERQHAD